MVIIRQGRQRQYKYDASDLWSSGGSVVIDLPPAVGEDQGIRNGGLEQATERTAGPEPLLNLVQGILA
jgi:hypothetical protein